LSSGEITLGGTSAQEFETPEPQRAEVDHGHQIQKDTHQQIVYFMVEVLQKAKVES
jgi:hypothetical protein